jgi:hypothetical protein
MKGNEMNTRQNNGKNIYANGNYNDEKDIVQNVYNLNSGVDFIFGHGFTQR